MKSITYFYSAFRSLSAIPRNPRACALILVASLASVIPLTALESGSVSIDVANPGIPVPSTLYGAFFEEINYAGEGGLYGELIRNRSFNSSNTPDFWTLVTPGTAGWVPSGGTWSIDSSVSPSAYVQSANGEDNRSVYAAPGSETWSNYSVSLQARKLSGSEGFFVMFNVADTKNWFRWNIGGWSNTQHAIQYSIDGVQGSGPQVSGSVATGQWYDIRVVIQGTSVQCYLNNVLTQTFSAAAAHTGSIGVSTWNTQAEYRNIVVTGADAQVLYASDFGALGGTTGEISVDSSKPLNATNGESLKLTMTSGTGSVGVANYGFWGIPLKAGSAYDLSLYACGEAGFTSPLTARLENADGSMIYAQTVFSGMDTAWQKFTAALVPFASDTNARLVISIDQPGTAWLDVVSLFPQETFMNRSNGMRKDLANAVAEMKPSFLRFPGGCYVEGSYVANAFNWKDSIGDISERPGHWAFWGYISTDGLGYHEYLQYAEDIGAEPLFCINAGISHGDVVPLGEMGPYVQDALDAIEYANGDVSTTWGAKRAANGHPAPFNMKYIQIGNENGGTDYNDRYALFYDAIKAAYPEMKLVVCVWGGTPTSRPFDLMDEHYYTDPATMASYATKYDGYSRSGPKVFVGEYAVTSGMGTYGNLSAALGEAAFMTGIERNCDVVSMASYAPLFCNLDTPSWTWRPDAIYYDNSRWFGTPAYYVQKMFANNVGSVLLPTGHDFHSGGIGLSTWNTQAEFRNIVVTDTNEQVLYQSDFDATEASEWSVGSGTWSVDTGVTPSAYLQSANGQDYQAVLNVAGSSDWKNYTLALQARKLGGSEGFLIMFHVADSNNWFWWNLGGWNNTTHAIESCINGAKSTGPTVGGSINTGQWYDIRISIHDGVADCYLDDVLTQTFNLPGPIHSVASMDENTREIILKTVNLNDTAVSADINLNGVTTIAPSAQWTLLTSNSTADENSLDAPDNVIPVTSSISTPSPQFTLELPAYSVNILRIQTPALPPQSLTVEAGILQATVQWTESAGAAAYTVMRATNSEGPYEVIASGITSASFTDTELIYGTTYYYEVLATNSAGDSPATAAAAVTPESLPITEAEAPTLEIIPSGGGSDTLKITSVPSVIGHVYQLQCNPELAAETWLDIGLPVPGTGAPLVFSVDFDPNEPRCFYRLLITR